MHFKLIFHKLFELSSIFLIRFLLRKVSVQISINKTFEIGWLETLNSLTSWSPVTPTFRSNFRLWQMCFVSQILWVKQLKWQRSKLLIGYIFSSESLSVKLFKSFADIFVQKNAIQKLAKNVLFQMPKI